MSNLSILNKCYYLPQLIASKTEEIKRLRDLSESIPGVDPSREFIPGGPQVQCRFAEIIDKVIDLENEILDDINELLDVQKEAHRIIDAVQDDTERLILQYYYIDRLEMEDIASEIGYSPRQAYRIKKNALKKIKNA
jgi:hypothetical protein